MVFDFSYRGLDKVEVRNLESGGKRAGNSHFGGRAYSNELLTQRAF